MAQRNQIAGRHNRRPGFNSQKPIKIDRVIPNVKNAQGVPAFIISGPNTIIIISGHRNYINQQIVNIGPEAQKGLDTLQDYIIILMSSLST